MYTHVYMCVHMYACICMYTHYIHTSVKQDMFFFAAPHPPPTSSPISHHRLVGVYVCLCVTPHPTQPIHPTPATPSHPTAYPPTPHGVGWGGWWVDLVY